MSPETPADWLRQGQIQEAANTAASVASAIESYRQAIALLKAQAGEPPAQRALGIALMNLGNARQKQPDAAAVDETVRAYDEAIALLQADAVAGDFELRNSIGAAWMNRGHALQRGASSGATTAALQSYDQAITVLETLPPSENRFFVLNLAGAWLNRAQALLTFPTPEASSAHIAAGNALKLVIGNAPTDPVAADIALKTYHALCASLSHQLSRSPSPVLIAETSDAIDESLALVRHWELQGVQNIRPFEIVFFRFGARFYLAHQPQFIAEFLLETLAHVRAPGVTPDNGELQTIATSALAQVRSDVYNRSLLNPKDDRLALLRQELDEAAQKFAQLFRTPEPTAGTALA